MMSAALPQLPTLYQHYTAGGINAGLSVDQPYFTLNERNITLFSGSMHYFRVPRAYWRDRLRKMRAAGLNAVETYVPWNLHEPESGEFDFGKGGSDMEQFLDVADFLRIAQEEDLLAIVRPGPYICAEWEFGGLPSWLLREKGIKVRTSQSTFMQYVTRYFNVLLPILATFQFINGGPIISFQVENEYGSTEEAGKFVPDKKYLEELRLLFLRNGIRELLFTSDSPTLHGSAGTIPKYFFQTANFASNPTSEFNRLKQLQHNKPSMATEFWSGWFDHWSENHHVVSAEKFRVVLEEILAYPASVNFYMFHGGTTFGFLNGANVADSSTDNKGFQPDTTSYDYDAPLTEAGDYTEKYVIVKELVKQYNTVPTRTPPAPLETSRRVFPSVSATEMLTISELLARTTDSYFNTRTLPMELLPRGQSYGYIVYRKEHVNIPEGSVLEIGGRVCDSVIVLINGKLAVEPLTGPQGLNGFGFWRRANSTLPLPKYEDATIDLLVENWGRVNFGNLDQYVQHKGLWQGGIYLNRREVLDWQMFSLDFKTKWTQGLTGWHAVPVGTKGPGLYKATLVLDSPQDTYVDMKNWIKGIVIVNGFVLGRYATTLGPQQTLYLPAPLMREGLNEILVFEHFFPMLYDIHFAENPRYKTPHSPISPST